MTPNFVAQLTLILSAFIVIGLLFTYLYAGHKIKGLLYAAIGLTCSSAGYSIVTLLTPASWLLYVSNILFLSGILLFYISTQRLVERRPNWLEVIIIALVFLGSLAIFHFAFVNVMVRQIIVSVAVMYMAVRQIYLLYRYIKIHPGSYLISYYVIAIVILCLQVVRLGFILFGINNNLVPTLGITLNSLILMTTAVIFVVLSLILIVTSSILTRNDLAKERRLLEEWSTTDYLTKAANRRKLYHHLETLIKQATPFAVVITDLDGFKLINDQYGHPVGDAVLFAYAKKIEEKKSPKAFLARFGGDEFVTVVTDYSSEDDIVANVITAIKLTNVMADHKQYDFDIRSSAGVALYPSDGVTINELLKKADHALYIIKTTRRNTVGFYRHLH